MKYQAVLHQTEEGFVVGCRGLPGCWSQGTTKEEALENIKIAITEYLDVVTEIAREAWAGARSALPPSTAE